MGIVHKEFDLAGQTVNSSYYCDVLWRLCENLPRILATKELAVASQHSLTLPFLPGNFFTKNSMTVIPHPPYFSVSQTEDKA
jgi:hypothetical protein